MHTPAVIDIAYKIQPGNATARAICAPVTVTPRGVGPVGEHRYEGGRARGAGGSAVVLLGEDFFSKLAFLRSIAGITPRSEDKEKVHWYGAPVALNWGDFGGRGFPADSGVTRPQACRPGRARAPRARGTSWGPRLSIFRQVMYLIFR